MGSYFLFIDQYCASTGQSSLRAPLKSVAKLLAKHGVLSRGGALPALVATLDRRHIAFYWPQLATPDELAVVVDIEGAYVCVEDGVGRDFSADQLADWLRV